jgi:hypothetical protein
MTALSWRQIPNMFGKSPRRIAVARQPRVA